MDIEKTGYVKHFPWKGKKCNGCKIVTKLGKNERYCDKCKDILRSLPIKIANTVRNGEMTTLEAIQYHRETQNKIENATMIKERFEDGRKRNCDIRQNINMDSFIEMARNLDTFTSAQIAKELNVNIQTAYKYLNQMHEDGILSREKCGKFAMWYFTGCNL